jgi:glucose/arabinose dehydrogenase
MQTPRALFLCIPAAALVAYEAAGDIPMQARLLQSGLGRPDFVVSPPGDTDRLFIVEQHSGQIKILNLASNTLNATPFFTMTDLSRGVEQGLVGLAFHPNYANNGLFYVNYTNGNGNIVVRRFTRSATNPNVANPGSGQLVLSVAKTEPIHNSGWMAFGPRDGLLYVSVGDGGGAYDQHGPIGNAQNTSNLLGKILRIDVNGDDFPSDANKNYRIPHGGPNPTDPVKNPFAAPYNNLAANPAGADEIWHYGLRNPWRATFDRKTADLYIGDVGQATREEIDFQPAGHTGGINFGWRPREGFIRAPRADLVPEPDPPDATDPILDYPHDATGGMAVTGGVVYRGGQNPALDGTYFYGDWASAKIWTIQYSGTGPASPVPIQNPQDATPLLIPVVNSPGTSIRNISSFGEDNLGRMYVTDLGTAQTSTTDGKLFELVPPIPGDANLDRVIDAADFAALYGNFGKSGQRWAGGDFNDDGSVNFLDFQILEIAFGKTVPLGALPDGTLVPEPASFGIVLLGSTLMLRRRCAR